LQKKGTNKKFSLLRARDKRRKERTRTGATVFMDMVVNIFVLSFCYVLYMRKERTLSRSKKPDEFLQVPKHKNLRIFTSRVDFFHLVDFFSLQKK